VTPDAPNGDRAPLPPRLRCRGEQARAAQEAEQQARRRRFPDLDAARSAARSPEQVERLAVAVEHWAQELAALERAVAATAGTGVDTDLAAAAATALDEAVTELAAAEADHRRADLARADTAKVARVWAEGLRALDQARLEQHRTRQATADVIRLAALAKGTGGQRRVALTTYVLRHWFGQVVAAANLRLAAMSGGRYELERSDEAAGRATRAGLTLTVIDRHTGRRRDPASLSGGETFFTSLALALGLAEVVSAEAGGVDLDTLFIDEGFGSLDSATLDQVMAVIDELRDRGRVVGIVSHVPDLLDRVPERLEVRRRADGSSFLQVVA
jgi:exonuclease SbcC